MGNTRTGWEGKPEANLCLALDFGGTKLAAGLVDWHRGEILRQVRCGTTMKRGAGGQITDMLALVHGMALSTSEEAALASIGVSFGGPVDATAGIVLQSHHIEGWDNLPLAARLRSEFARPVYMENDANAIALGEYRYGAGRGVDSLVYMTVSTGIGGGVVLGGRLWRGAHGLAGEIGHTVVRPQGPICTCGNHGCLESLASGQSIARRAREALQAGGEGERLLGLVDSRPERITAEVVFRAARAGDPLAATVINEVAEDLGLGIAMFCSIVDPARVILGGGVAKAGEQLLAPVRKAFRRYAFPMLVDDVQIVQAAALDDGGLLGAAALVAQAME